eukprot:15293574-Alexandrium_andersonii.AAC.1
MLSSCSDWRSASAGARPMRTAAAITRSAELPPAWPPRGTMSRDARMTRFMAAHWWMRGPEAFWTSSSWDTTPRLASF